MTILFQFNSSVFSFIDHAFGIDKNACHRPRSQRFSPVFFPKILYFWILHLSSRCLLY